MFLLRQRSKSLNRDSNSWRLKIGKTAFSVHFQLLRTQLQYIVYEAYCFNPVKAPPGKRFLTENIILCLHYNIIKVVMALFLNVVFSNVFYINVYNLYQQNIPISNKCWIYMWALIWMAKHTHFRGYLLLPLLQKPLF